MRYTIVSALRTGEARLSTIDEFDLAARVHTLPPPRTKTRIELRVPLSDEAMRILELCETRRTSRYLFEGQRTGKPLSDMAMLEKLRGKAPGLTVHGFRSSFRDWCGETGIPRELAEACLGHTIGSKVEAAYFRSDILERRRDVMARWSAFLTGRGAAADITLIKEGRRAG